MVSERWRSTNNGSERLIEMSIPFILLLIHLCKPLPTYSSAQSHPLAPLDGDVAQTVVEEGFVEQLSINLLFGFHVKERENVGSGVQKFQLLRENVPDESLLLISPPFHSHIQNIGGLFLLSLLLGELAFLRLQLNLLHDHVLFLKVLVDAVHVSLPVLLLWNGIATPLGVLCNLKYKL